VVPAPGALGRPLVPLGRALQEERGRQASEHGGMLRHESSGHVHAAGQTHRYWRPRRRRRAEETRPLKRVAGERRQRRRRGRGRGRTTTRTRDRLCSSPANTVGRGGQKTELRPTQQHARTVAQSPASSRRHA